jgi:eukaryotic-like serine/threonine-protein kinase
MSLAPGTRLGRYEIRSKIGEGGMGEVYLGQDTKLDRKVALKILPTELAANQDRMRRFVQEAKAASALNHPNIITIYEIDETDSGHFIATEFIDGGTLRERMLTSPWNPDQTLDVAVQIASALAAAHAAGIIHRDVKPENVMVRHDGIVKVLDFGLAKLTAPLSVDAVDFEAPTRAQVKTDPGVLMGTAVYMSPEQARGLPVDARTDVFSLGIVLYEMVTGRLPFDGSNRNEIMASILSDKEPQPLARYSSDAPTELGRIVSKALRKNRDERYQSLKEMLLDLQSLKQELEFEKKIERSMPTKSEGSTAATKSAETAITAEIRRPRFLSNRAFIVSAVVLVLVVAVALTYWLVAHRSAATTRPPEIKSLAVLPLKSLDAGENYMGLGIADALIRRISQTGELTVRPTSAVRRYLNEEADALTAARELKVDAVLEGNIQQAGDLLRVSVNLLRVSDGTSLWTDSFSMQMADVFTVEDTMSQQVASRLRLQLDAAQQARLTKRSTSNPVAYDYYVKGVYQYEQLDVGEKEKPRAMATIDLFKKAIEADPNYALAYAQLGNVYAVTAIFIEPNDTAWVERAREEISRAEALDPQIAETHIARALLLWSAYEGWQIEAAIRELRSAQQLNPGFGHTELAGLYQHAGLEDLAAHELQRALDIDPTSDFAKGQTVNQPYMVRKYHEALAAAQKSFGAVDPSASYFPNISLLMSEGRFDEAQKAIEEFSAKEPDDPFLPQTRALFFALKGDFRSAEAQIPSVLKTHPVKTLTHHHATYDIASIYALEGKSDEAIKWLRETAAMGFPCYPLFARDAYLNRIRQAPAFIQFMAEMKAQNERYRREFSEGATQ